MGCHTGAGGSGSAKGSGGAKAGNSGMNKTQNYTTSDNTVMTVPPTTIQGGYGTNKDTIDKVLEVTAKGNGEISLVENRGVVIGGSRKYPVTEYKIKGASIITDKDYKVAAEDNGINWANVKIISGSTYGIGSLVKPKGFEYDRAKGVWIKK